MHKKIALIVCVALGIPAAGHALTFDVRGGYRAGSHSYESRYKVSQGWQNGWWASMEMDNKTTKITTREKMAQIKRMRPTPLATVQSIIMKSRLTIAGHSRKNGPCSQAVSITGAVKAPSYGLIFVLTIKRLPISPLDYVIAMTTTLTKRLIASASHIATASTAWIYMLIINLMPNGVPCIKARSIDMSTMTINIIMINLRRQKTP